MKYTIILVVAILFSLSSCSSFVEGFKDGFEEGYDSSSNNDSYQNNIKQSKNVSASSNTLDSSLFTNKVIPLESDYIELGTYNLSIIGATLDKSTNNVVDDSMSICGVIDNSFVDTTDLGFNVGFYNSSNPEIEKKDAYLSIYIDYKFNNLEISQRDSIIPELKISAKDNLNEELDLLYFSNEDNYINTESPYGLIVFKVYYDSDFFTIIINDAEYIIDTSLLLK